MLQNLINKYQILQVSAQKELMDYLDDLLQKQENNKQIHKIEPQKLNTIINQYQGIGKGIWNKDAQEDVNQLREDDRI
jgi:rubrerythrin